VKQPVKLVSPDVDQVLRSEAAAPARARRGRGGAKAREARAHAVRPRTPVAGGKALARINFFKIQRGILPDGGPAPAAAAAPRAATSPSAAENLIAGLTASRAQMASEALAAVPVAQAWQPLGPFHMPHGQTYGQGPGSRPPVAGRVSAIAVDPANPAHVLCGSAGGGVWETTDAGRTWVPRFDDQLSLAVGAVAFDPSNPRRVFAGTGEGNVATGSNKNVRAAGLLASTDGGKTWSAVPGTPFVGVSFFRIVVDPADGQHLLAATTNGLYESPDSGTTWNRRRTAFTWDVSKHPVVPTNPATGDEVFAATADGLLRSSNGGTSWRPVTLPGLPAGFVPKRMAVCHAPSNGSVVYVAAAGPPQVLDPVESQPKKPVEMPKPYIWRRSTFGGAFTAVALPSDLQTGQAWYDWFATVAPNNPDVLYIGGINAHRGIRQPSGDWSWENISGKKPTGDSVHPDQHTIAFSPADPNVVYLGNDGGIYRSADAGTTWESLNKGLCITEIEFLAQHPEYDAWLLAGTQDNGTVRYEGQQTWYQVQDGDGGACAVDEPHPATCYHAFYGAYLEKSTRGGGWKTWNSTVPKALADEDSLFYPPLAVNGQLVVRAATGVWISRDSGGTWKPISLPGLTGYPSALTAPNQNRVFAGSATGELYRFDRTGTTWSVTPLTSPRPGGYVSDLLAESGLWATVNKDGVGRVYHSTAEDADDWTDVSTGIPDTVAVHAIEIDRSNPSTLFVGTDVGVYWTNNSGSSWAPLARGLPNVLVKDVSLHQRTRLLRAGTQARGVWELAIDPPTMPDVGIYLRDHAADTGRVLPSADNVSDPFDPGGPNLFWWQSPDIKVDASPFQVPALDDLDFAVYSDDRSKIDDSGIEFAAGLKDERPVLGQTARIYVQVHNRGTQAAQNVAVRVFAIRAALTWPDLPAGFWTNFPNNVLPAASAWQPVAAHRVIPAIDSGRSAVIGFEWAVPITAGPSVGLLAVVSADNDPIAETEVVVSNLVRKSRHCSLRNYAVVNPSPLAGPTVPGMVMDVWPADVPLSLTLDQGGRALVRGVVLDKGLRAAAKKAGWTPVKLTTGDAEFLAQLTDRRPELKQRLALGGAWRPTARAAALPLGKPHAGAAQAVVLLFDLKSKSGVGSAVVTGEDEAPRGGLTVVNLPCH
jgi:photosystem II stability/assembly factor-like uncharacterized protein